LDAEEYIEADEETEEEDEEMELVPEEELDFDEVRDYSCPGCSWICAVIAFSLALLEQNGGGGLAVLLVGQCVP
jgi:hypothetical protein